MNRICLLLLVSAISLASEIAHGEFNADVRDAGSQVRAAREAAERLVKEGRVAEANRTILAVFPEKSRSPAQAFLLANILFRQDPQESYKLHKQVAAKFPDEDNVQFEWGLEQHRRQEYAGAAEWYAKYAKSNPNYAPVLGLMAECLIRTGKTREAVDAWQRSEKAQQGTLEQLESLVCEVHTTTVPDSDRAALRSKVEDGDATAAEALIALDCQFPFDWWNNRARPDYLKRDLKLISDSDFENEQRIREVVCAGECTLAANNEGDDVGAILRKAGFLFDEANTLPMSGRMLSTMLAAAESTDVISFVDARDRWGAAILDQAKKTRDAETFNVAAHLYLESNKLEEIHRLGWNATGDERFAVGVILDLAAQSALTLDNPELVKALKQFPENAMLAAEVVALSNKAGKPMVPVIVAAIKAEYSHFSLSGLLPRPSAAALRRYFARLAKELAGQKET